MAKFNSGDVVKLKSGSPKMTVRGYHKNDPQMLTCIWFDDNEMKAASFKEDSLEESN